MTRKTDEKYKTRKWQKIAERQIKAANYRKKNQKKAKTKRPETV